MNATTKLTDTQRAVLERAATDPNGLVTRFPDSVKGGARQKVLDGLFNRALITRCGDDWMIAAEGYDAIGRERPEPTIPDATQVLADEVGRENPSAAEIDTSNDIDPVTTSQRRTRDDSKQAQVIAMLKRPEGATINQICDTTGWQAHTVRGAFAGSFKKKLGLDITSTKPEDGERIYRIA